MNEAFKTLEPKEQVEKLKDLFKTCWKNFMNINDNRENIKQAEVRLKNISSAVSSWGLNKINNEGLENVMDYNISNGDFDYINRTEALIKNSILCAQVIQKTLQRLKNYSLYFLDVKTGNLKVAIILDELSINIYTYNPNGSVKSDKLHGHYTINFAQNYVYRRDYASKTNSKVEEVVEFKNWFIILNHRRSLQQ